MSIRQPKRITKEEPHKKLDPREVKSRSTARPSGSYRDNDPYYDEYEFHESVKSTREPSVRETRYQRATRNVYDDFTIEDEVSYTDDYDDVRRYGKRNGISKARRVVGKVILYLQLVASIVAFILILRFHVLKDTTVIIIGILLVLAWLINFIFQRKHFNKGQAVSMVISIILCIVLVGVSLLLIRTNTMLQTVTSGRTYDISRYDVAVRADNPAQKVSDTSGYVYGIQPTFKQEELASVISQVQQDVGGEIETVQMGSSLGQAQALLNGEVDALIYNDAFTSTILEQIEDYENQVRILDTYMVKTETEEIKTAEVVENSNTILVYISGTDSEGEVSMTGRSDVNIVAGINTGTKEILLITIPRDYYVEFPGITAPGTRDKLTHAGIYGMDELILTVQHMLEYDMNYYVRVNFSSLENIIDAMGGIAVYNEKDFVSHAGLIYPEGMLYMNGLYALHYVRERFAFEDGDFARGRNQVKVMQAMLDKLASVNTLANYSAVADAISKSVSTNIPTDTITELINIQLSENPAWHVVSYQMLGKIMFQPCQSANGAYLSVDMPYQEAIENAQILLKQLLDGEVLSEDLQLTEDDQLTFVTQPVG